jgi:hypothetical protein
MKTKLASATPIVAVMLTTMFTNRCSGEMLLQSLITDMRFAGASEEQRSSFPLLFAVEFENETEVLRLGNYSTNDVDQTFTFTRANAGGDDLWNDVVEAMQGEYGVRPGIRTFWLHSEPSVQTGFLGEGIFPNFLLERVEVTPDSFSMWDANSLRYYTASFTVRMYWSIPEPTSLMLALGAASSISMRRRRRTFLAVICWNVATSIE